MKDTMLELLEVCRQKELYCMHNDVDDLIESALNSKLLSINLKSQRLDKEKQEVKNIVEQPTKRRTRITESLQNFRVIHKKSSISLNNTSKISPINAIAPVLPTEEPEYSLSMGYEHLSTILKMESDEIIKSSVENLVPIPSEYEGIFDNTCDVPVCVDSSTFDVLKDHSEILSDSNNDDTSSDDDAFEDIEYVEASLPDYELVSLEEENDVYQEEKEIDVEDILQIQDVILREKLLSINRLIADIELLNDNPTPDRVLKSSSSFPIFEKFDNSLSYSDNSLPKIETFSDHTKETRSGSTTAHANNSPPEYDSFCFEIEPDQGDNSIPPGIENIDYDSEGDIYFLEEFLSNESLPLPENESSNFDHHDDPSFPRPPPEPPNVEIFFEPDSDVLTTNVVKGISEHYVLMPNILPTLPTFDPLYPVYDTLLMFSSENEDKVFKPSILSYLLVSLDFQNHRVLLCCDSTGPLYPVTKPSPIPQVYLTSQNMWHQRLGHPRTDGTLSRYKARLVTNGSTQIEGIDVDETFSPVVKPGTIRTVLSLALSRHWPIHHLDVKNSFLHGDLAKTVYMHQPPGFWDPAHPDHVCLLQRSLYGLKQADFSGLPLTLLELGLVIVRKYATEILERAHMIGCNPGRTPVNTKFKLRDDGDLVADPTLYRSLAGSLQYLTFTRPDISYVVQQVCLHMHDPCEPHFSALKRILCRRSTSGYCVFLGNNLLSWSSKRQPTLYRSSAEAEYRDVANAVAETCWLRNLPCELHTSLSSATLVYCDNDLVAAGQVRVLHVPFRYQYADVFTKGLPTALFEEFRSSLSVRCPPAQTAGEC
nr:ribonuclease H-like domain-containing protein [Tanacetum cinerariifolium]